MYTFHPLKLWSYWTEVYEMFIRFRQIVVDKPYKIGSAILQPVSEC